MVRKQVTRHADVPCLVLVVKFRVFMDLSGKKTQTALEAVVGAAPDSCTAVAFKAKGNEWLMRKAKKVPSSRIHP